MVWDFLKLHKQFGVGNKIYHYTSGIYLYTSNNGSAANLYTFYFQLKETYFEPGKKNLDFFFNVLTDYLNEISTDLVTELDFNVIGLLYI